MPTVSHRVIAVVGLSLCFSAGLALPSAGQSAPRRDHAATTKVASCKTLSTMKIGSALGSTMYYRSGGLSPSAFTAFGSGHQVYRVAGKALRMNMLYCNYAHVPGSSSLIGQTGLTMSITYAIVASPARARAVVKWLCYYLRAQSSGYSTPAIGGGACFQGHGGAMESSNGYLSVGDVVVQLFGGAAPSQTIALARAMVPVLTKAKWGTIMVNRGPSGAAVTIRSNQFTLANGSVALALSCSGAPCHGTAQLVNAAAVSSAAVVATTNYSITPSASSTTIQVRLTPAGATLFATTTFNPVPLTLSVTVSGGRTDTAQVQVSFQPSNTTTTTTTTTTTGP